MGRRTGDEVMGNAMALGWMCAGVGMAALILGLLGVLGWLGPVEGPQSAVVLFVGLGLLAIGAAAVVVAEVGMAIVKGRQAERGE